MQRAKSVGGESADAPGAVREILICLIQIAHTHPPATSQPHPTATVGRGTPRIGINHQDAEVPEAQGPDVSVV